MMPYRSQEQGSGEQGWRSGESTRLPPLAAPCLNSGVTLAVFQRVGNFPVENDMLISLAVLGARIVAAIRKNLALILSIPAAL